MKFRRDVLWLMVAVVALGFWMASRTGAIDPRQETDDIYEAVIRYYALKDAPLFVSLNSQDFPATFMHRFGGTVRPESAASETYEHNGTPIVVDPSTRKPSVLLNCADVVTWQRGSMWRDPVVCVYTAAISGGLSQPVTVILHKHKGRWIVEGTGSGSD